MNKKRLIVMFVKEPKLGFVKTRLAKHTSEAFALDLYKSFVQDLLETLENTSYEFKLCGYPTLDLITKIFGAHKNFLQVEGDLGLKMQCAFEEQFLLKYEQVLLIGSDTPHILLEDFDACFEGLNHADIALAPSADGGYYLIGFNKHTFYTKVFDDITWSTSQVLNQTLQKLNEKRLYLHKELNDIDTLEDLREFYLTYQETLKHTHTMKYLKGNSLWKNLMSS